MLVPGITALAAAVVGAIRRWTRGSGEPPTTPPDQARRGRVQRCSRCDHPFLTWKREPNTQWFVLCPTCVVDTRRALIALLALYVLVGLIVLGLSAGL